MRRITVDVNLIRFAVWLRCSGVSSPHDICSVIRAISWAMSFIIWYCN